MTPWTAAHQAPLSISISWSLLKLMFVELVMLSNYLILCHFLLLLPSVFLSIWYEFLRQGKQTGPICESPAGSQISGSSLCSLDAGDISRKDQAACAPPAGGLSHVEATKRASDLSPLRPPQPSVPSSAMRWWAYAAETVVSKGCTRHTEGRAWGASRPLREVSRRDSL